jgi:hypothetical protein
LVLVGMQNATFGSYLAASLWILVSVMNWPSLDWGRRPFLRACTSLIGYTWSYLARRIGHWVPNYCAPARRRWALRAPRHRREGRPAGRQLLGRRPSAAATRPARARTPPRRAPARKQTDRTIFSRQTMNTRRRYTQCAAGEGATCRYSSLMLLRV